MNYTSLPNAPSLSTRVKCLVVDDIEENLIALEALLQHEDIDILTASSGQAALELLLHNDVALALLDVQMPEMNGFELAELIRGSERTRHVPLIFITAGSREQNWQFKGYETGAVDFLYKPIDAHALVNKAHIFFELHRQKRALAHELQERTESLRLNEMYMAVLSHDLRNPLTAILMGAVALQRPHADPAKVQALAQQIQSSGRRMAKMIEDLLDVARVRQAGSMPLSLEAASMDKVVQRAAQELCEGASGRCIHVDKHGDLDGVWDSERLLQVASNLMGNALQHGQPGTVVQVTVDGTAAASVVLSVANDGALAEGLKAHLFNPFRERTHHPGRHQGLGLGLYIAQQIVLAHGGAIEALSDSARTTFRVQLPRVSQRSEGRGRF